MNLVQATASLSGLLFGFDTAIIATALGAIKDEFQLKSDASLGLFVSIALLGAMIGSLGGGRVADARGRRNIIIAADAAFLLGALCMAVAPTFSLLLLGRFLVGLAIGASANVVPVFLTELAEKLGDDHSQRRGSFVGINVVFITFGQLMAYLVGLVFIGRWRLTLGSAAVPALVQAVAMHHACKKAELTEFPPRFGSQPSFLDQIKTLRDKRVQLGVRLHVLQQVSGINLVLYWSPLIVANAWSGGTDQEHEQSFALQEPTRTILLASMLPVAVNCIGSWISLCLIDKAGRRLLLLTSMTGSAMIMALTSLAFALDAGGPLIVSLLTIFVLLYSIGLGSVPWLCAEIFPPDLRGSANGICTSANWFTNMVLSQVRPLHRLLPRILRCSRRLTRCTFASSLPWFIHRLGSHWLQPSQWPPVSPCSAQLSIPRRPASHWKRRLPF